MNRFGLIAAFAVLCVAPALTCAQPLSPAPAVPKPLPESSVAPSGELQEVVPPRPARNQMSAQRDRDARHCLELPTNRQVHRCAERYRAHVARMKAARTAQEAKAAPAMDTAKASGAARSAVATRPGELKLIEPAPPATAAKPADAAKAPMTAQPAESAKATATAKSGDGAKSAATATAKSPEPVKPITPAVPATPAKPVEPAKSVK